MILRLWRARASRDNPDAYIEHFRRNLSVELKSVPGFRGASVYRQDRPDGVEFLVLSLWESADAIRAFAGDDIGRAVVEPGAIAALIDYDDRVQHFRLVEEIAGAGPETA
jgi:heme-degrading monooxygenase HmoA